MLFILCLTPLSLAMSLSETTQISLGLYQNSKGSQVYLETIVGRAPIIDGWYNRTTAPFFGTYLLIGLLGPDVVAITVANGEKKTNITKSKMNTPNGLNAVVTFSVLWLNGLYNDNAITSWTGIVNSTHIVASSISTALNIYVRDKMKFT